MEKLMENVMDLWMVTLTLTLSGSLVHIEKVKTDNITHQALCYHI